MTTEIEAKRKELETWILFNEKFSPKLTINQFGQLLELGEKIRKRTEEMARKEFLDKIDKYKCHCEECAFDEGHINLDKLISVNELKQSLNSPQDKTQADVKNTNVTLTAKGVSDCDKTGDAHKGKGEKTE